MLINQATMTYWILQFTFISLPFYEFIYLFIYLFIYCSNIVVSIILPPLSPAITTPTSQYYPPLALSMGPLYMFLDKHSPSFPCYSPPQPLWLLSVCSVFQYLWFDFACLFVLLIRFHLQVRSYGICLSLPGLFHLA